jgi:hypothetical protein
MAQSEQERHMRVGTDGNLFIIEVQPPFKQCADIEFSVLALKCYLLNGGKSQAFTFRRRDFEWEDIPESTRDEAFLDFAHVSAGQLAVTHFDDELYVIDEEHYKEMPVIKSLFELSDKPGTPV